MTMAQISLTLPDGNARSYDSGVSPLPQVAADISSFTWRKRPSRATVDGQHWDLAMADPERGCPDQRSTP